MVRHAFTMIELIFALVIMGIVFVTLPVILINNANSVEDNLIQESIFLTSSKMSQALTFQWDNNSSEAGMSTVSTSDVLDVAAGDSELDRNASDFRVGHFSQDKHRRMTPIGNPRSATAIGREGTIYDDIDDFDDWNQTMNTVSTDPEIAKFGYKKAYLADVNVSYINDSANYANNSINFIFNTNGISAQTTNIKMVEVSIDQNNSNGWQTTMVLRAFVANIGETDYFKRRY